MNYDFALAFVLKVLVTLNPNVPANVAYERYVNYYNFVAHTESDYNRYSLNAKSGAESYFQMTSDAFETAKRRAYRYGIIVDKDYVSELTFQEQRVLAFVDSYARKGTNKFIKCIIQKENTWCVKEFYLRYWHTDREQKGTMARVNKIIKEYYK